MSKEKELKIEVVDEKDGLKKSTALITTQVDALKIKDEDDYLMSQSIGNILNENIKKIIAYFKPIKDSTNKAHKEAVAMEKDFLKEPNRLKSLLKKLMLDFETEQENIRLAKEKAIQDKLAAQAKIDLQKQLDAGIEQADAVAAMVIPEEVHVASSFKASGSVRHNYKGEVTDFALFLAAAIAAGRTELIEVNQSALNSYASQAKGKAVLNGVRFYDNATKVF